MRSIKKGKRWNWLCTLVLASLMLVLPAMAVSAEEATAVSAEEQSTEPVTQQIAGSAIPSEAQPIPDHEWQLDVTFPDWDETVSASLAMNNRVGFYGYHGQGELWLSCSEDCSGFTLYVNDHRIGTDEYTAGWSGRLDISGLTRDGWNSLQVSGIGQGTVRVCIPYPVILDGSLEESGIRPEAIDLIDRIITADIAHGFPSAQLAIVKDGRLVYENAWGNVQTYDENGSPVESVPVTTDTLYDLASNTKMYSVNYAIQYMLTRGEISLDQTIAEILGDGFWEDTIHIAYEGYEDVPLDANKEWKRGLTIRNLLMHQGGFPAGPHYYNDRYDNATQYYDSDAGNVLYAGTGADEATKEETVRQIFRTPLMYEPGTQTLYSDVDYMVLGLCVEKLSGKSLDAYLREVFWEPMGLNRITYNPLANGFAPEDCAATELMGNSRDGNLHYTDIRTDLLQGEVHDPNAWYCMAGVAGHAGMFASASDLAKLASVMLTGGYGDHRYFSRDVLDIFTAPRSIMSPAYGLGWWRESDHVRDKYFGTETGSGTFGHQGFTGTLTMIDPDRDLVVVLLTNKIHTRLLMEDGSLNDYRGGFYTTGNLGFVAQILEIGCGDSSSDGSGEVDSSVWKDLVSDMAADEKRLIEEAGITDPAHPRMQAYEALMSVLEDME